MSKIRLYHGTNIEFDLLDPSLSRPFLDFGSGCYLTLSLDQAWGMAKRKYKIFGGRPKVLVYEFDEDNLSAEGVKVFDDYTIEWTEFIIQNRYFQEYRNSFKVIVGPVADGTIPDDIDDYMKDSGDEWNKPENLGKLSQKLKFENELNYIQYCFRDSKSIAEYLELKENIYE